MSQALNEPNLKVLRISILRTRKLVKNKIPQALNEQTLNGTLRHYVFKVAHERDESS